MMEVRLSPLALRIVRLLLSSRPPWLLTGHAATAGRLGEELTDLDLCWRGIPDLGPLPHLVDRRLTGAGLLVTILDRSPEWSCLLVTDEGNAACRLSLSAEPGPNLERPTAAAAGDVAFPVDSPHDVLVSRLGAAAAGRLDLQCLVDLFVLLETVGVLERALVDVPRRQAGFSPLRLAWRLHKLDLHVVGSTLGMGASSTEVLDRFKKHLTQRILWICRPVNAVF